MTTLEKIVKKAQALKKSYPNKFAKWTDYVKEASKEFRSTTTTTKKKSKLGENSEKYLLKLADNYAYVTSGNLDRAIYNLLDPQYTKI